MKIVVVCTSAADFQGHATGVWLEELAAPYYLFKEAGYEVVLASPAGGPIPVDAGSLAGDFFTEHGKKFMHDAAAVGALSHSVKVDAIDWSNKSDVDGIFLSGGHGTCVDFINNPALKSAIESMFASGKVVAAVCHGPLALCDCIKPDGTPLVAGKQVAAFSDSEEQMTPYLSIVPFLLESKLKELGGKYEKGDDWGCKVCVDGKLVTGQNPNSSEEASKAVVTLLG
jgi:putative intracellular protease/amidase